MNCHRDTREKLKPNGLWWSWANFYERCWANLKRFYYFTLSIAKREVTSFCLIRYVRKRVETSLLGFTSNGECPSYYSISHLLPPFLAYSVNCDIFTNPIRLLLANNYCIWDSSLALFLCGSCHNPCCPWKCFIIV